MNLISCYHEWIIINLYQLRILEHIWFTVCNYLIRDRLLLNAKIILISRNYFLEWLRRLFRRWVFDVVDSKLVCFTRRANFDKFDRDNLA